MSAVVVDAIAVAVSHAAATAPARVALLGTGNVGRAVLARLDGWCGTALGEQILLAYVANSRVAVRDHGGLSPSPVGVSGCVYEPSDRAYANASSPCDGAGVRVGARGRRSGVIPSSPSTPHPPFGLLLSSAHPSGAVGEGKGVCASDLDDVAEVLGGRDTRILIDATASNAVAGRHAQWLAQGIHVVTACKLGQGSDLARWRAIRAACAHGNTEYGDAATVGAGLPLLRSIRELQAGGDRIHAIAGVLSGSLAWLFNHYDGLRPFSGFVREARAAGYTEPDPREDLSGEDVRRKLLILSRAAGVELEADDVEVDSLVPPALAALQSEAVDAALPLLDAPLRERFAAAYKKGEKLRFIAGLQCGDDDRDIDRVQARIGLESLAADHPLAGGAGTDNRVAIWSDRYREQPLVIQGPGAGAEVTAAALLDDVLRIGRKRGRA